MLAYDRDNGERICSLDFGIIESGESSREIEVWLWNMKDHAALPTATDVRISVAATNPYAGDIVDSKLVKVKSSGVTDPDDAGIVDDAETEFTPIGGGLTESGMYHGVGDTPSNCARRLTFRLDLPDGFVVKGRPKLVLQIGYMSGEVKWLYADD